MFEDHNKEWTLNYFQDKVKENTFYQKITFENVHGDGNKEDISFLYFLIGLSEECGEMMGWAKKFIRDKACKFDDKDKEKIIGEIGDIQWYCNNFLNCFGITMDDVAKYNDKKLKDRHTRGVIRGSGDNR
ncbi:MAG: nucleoside triphosphate pyrophosphohydrolase family protein [Candidatus Woesearchaeota archaeon]|jgi:NTP pyrophosphatase (non-canonical NTP hydrolase)